MMASAGRPIKKGQDLPFLDRRSRRDREVEGRPQRKRLGRILVGGREGKKIPVEIVNAGPNRAHISDLW